MARERDFHRFTGGPPQHVGRWAVDPTQNYKGLHVRHLCEPRSLVTLCGKQVGPGWGQSSRALRCETCVAKEEKA